MPLPATLVPGTILEQRGDSTTVTTRYVVVADDPQGGTFQARQIARIHPSWGWMHELHEPRTYDRTRAAADGWTVV